jgi:glycosyltransferase involved in cell wall biosynthesis
VAGRVARFWGRDSVVIPPPVDVDFFAAVPRASHPEDFLLSVGRLISYKRHDFAIAVGEAAGIPVRIVGTGPLEEELRELAARATVPVEVITTNAAGTDRPTREEVRDQMARARALVFAAYEDFGIVPVEAAAVGLPVLGINRGGVRDSVVSGTTGILLDDETPAAFADALSATDALDPAVLRAHAQGFSVAEFHRRFRDWVLAEEAAHGGAAR